MCSHYRTEIKDGMIVCCLCGHKIGPAPGVRAMEEGKWAPGPWVALPVLTHGEFDISAGGHVIAAVYSSDGMDEPIPFPAEANARLIAAAPDLLEMLIALLRQSNSPKCDPASTVDLVIDGALQAKAIALVAKATGTTP